MRGRRVLPSPPLRARLSPQRRRSFGWYAFVGPPFGLIALFVILPTLQAFFLSLFQGTGGAPERFVGLGNYGRLLGSQVFLNAIANTVILGVAFLIVILPLTVVLASLLNNLRRGATTLKVIYFLPQITSAVAVAVVFNYIFQPQWGLLNGLLRSAGVDPLPLWLADPRFSLTGSRAAVTILAVWMATGYYVLIFLAGLQTIPTDLYDAAKVDGANSRQTWRFITLPGLRPTFVFLLITGAIDAMVRFSDVFTLGGPGGTPARSLQTIVTFIYQAGFDSYDFYLASAASVTLFVLVSGITLVSFRALLSREFGR
jgi:ABC-type sugar transport system permease subunit